MNLLDEIEKFQKLLILASAAEDRIRMNLRGFRERAGVTQTEMADAMGIAGSYLCDLEHGRRRLSPKLASRLRSALEGPHPHTLREES